MSTSAFFKKGPKNSKGFTLIELLIVVAIIAILAAIAVPNFLEAQTRSKVSRLLADMRSVRVALEAYNVDSNRYPESDFGIRDMTQTGVGLWRCTTPIAYITSIPQSPFTEGEIGNPGTPQNAVTDNTVLYVRAATASTNITDSAPADGIDDNYQKDRVTYLRGFTVSSGIPPAQIEISRTGFWMMKSVGPNNIDDRDGTTNDWGDGGLARVYDPTNGTVSPGDIVTFQDTVVGAGPGR